MEYTLEQLAYPIGKFEAPAQPSEKDIAKWIRKLEHVPKWYDAIIENLDEEQLNTRYRPNGWTINQVIHHVADSHMNAYIRIKLALTEDTPTIKPYAENLWAELPDVQAVPVNVSITLIHALHRRWIEIFKNMTQADFVKCYFHPEQNRKVPLWEALAMYAWHGEHHFEQINRLRQRRNW